MSDFTVGVLTFVVAALLALGSCYAQATVKDATQRVITLVVNVFVVAVVLLAAFRLI